MINVGVIGLGVGAEHLAAYEAQPGCRVAAVCDLLPEKLTQVRDKSIRLTRDADEVLNDPDIDLVSIASFDDHHFNQVVKALRTGKHVFVEKPLCASMEELRIIKEECNRKPGLHLRSNLVLRAAPLYQMLRAEVKGERLGRVYCFDGDYLYGRMHKITEGWRKDVPNYSVICGGAIHLIDLMLWITGERPSAVTAIGNRICSEGSAFRYNDFVAATFRFPSGLIGRINANFGCIHPHQHVVRLFATNATFIYDDRGPRWHKSRIDKAEGEMIALSPFPGSKGSLIPDFVENIREKRWADHAQQQEFDVMSACLAAEAALASGEAIPVEYV